MLDDIPQPFFAKSTIIVSTFPNKKQVVLNIPQPEHENFRLKRLGALFILLFIVRGPQGPGAQAQAALSQVCNGQARTPCIISPPHAQQASLPQESCRRFRASSCEPPGPATACARGVLCGDERCRAEMANARAVRSTAPSTSAQRH